MPLDSSRCVVYIWPVMNFLGAGIPVGTYWGIAVRLHFTFVLYAWYRIQQYGDWGHGLAFIAGLYFCILLHEFGHALAARWCDGDCDLIILWPLGGLAFCRPAFNATANLITTVAGPLVTLVLWLLFSALAWFLANVAPSVVWRAPELFWFIAAMAALNKWLLIFNMIPAFPMDGGRILRDLLWHWMGAERSTRIAVFISRSIAITVGIWAFSSGQTWLGILAVFLLLQGGNVEQILAAEASGTYDFSLRERIKRGFRKRAFVRSARQSPGFEGAAPFHRCAACGRTENDSPELDFRICPECSGDLEYCQEHLRSHPHR